MTKLILPTRYFTPFRGLHLLSHSACSLFYLSCFSFISSLRFVALNNNYLNFCLRLRVCGLFSGERFWFRIVPFRSIDTSRRSCNGALKGRRITSSSHSSEPKELQPERCRVPNFTKDLNESLAYWSNADELTAEITWPSFTHQAWI